MSASQKILHYAPYEWPLLALMACNAYAGSHWQSSAYLLEITKRGMHEKNQLFYTRMPLQLQGSAAAIGFKHVAVYDANIWSAAVVLSFAIAQTHLLPQKKDAELSV